MTQRMLLAYCSNQKTFRRGGEMSKLPDEITISWHFTDVQDVDDSLTNEEARQVLQLIKKNHDATIGVNWESIEAWIDYFKSNQKVKA